MLPCFTLLLLGLSVCTTAGDNGEELALSAKAEPWVIVTLQGDAIPSIQLQVQEAKRGKASQFFGLMGKRVGGTPELQPGGTGYQLARILQGLLGKKGSSTEGIYNGIMEDMADDP